MTIYVTGTPKSQGGETAPTPPASGGGEGGEPLLLGNTTKSCNSPDSRRLERWAMQSAAREILPSERVCQCLRSISKFKQPSLNNPTQRENVYSLDYYRNVEVLKSGEKFHYGNLMTCGSVWHCPICAGKISERRRSELVDAVSTWTGQGGQVRLLTLTVPHYSHQKLQVVLNGLSAALRRLTNSREWKTLVESIGLYGRIRSLEVTYGQNGWHPHFHLLLFTYKPFDLVELQGQILHLWKTACLRSSLPVPNHHGVKVDNGELAAQYVGKWGLEHEMTKGHIKKSREGYSPFDLLRLHLGVAAPGRFLDDDPSRAAQLFREYAKCFKGKRQLVWSKGLRLDLLTTEEQTDEEIADAVEPDAELFALVPLSTWKVILFKQLRGVVLEKCREGKPALDDYLTQLSKFTIEYNQPEIPLPPEPEYLQPLQMEMNL